MRGCREQTRHQRDSRANKVRGRKINYQPEENVINLYYYQVKKKKVHGEAKNKKIKVISQNGIKPRRRFADEFVACDLERARAFSPLVAGTRRTRNRHGNNYYYKMHFSRWNRVRHQ